MKRQLLLASAAILSFFLITSCASERDKAAREIAALEKQLIEQTTQPGADKLNALMDLYTGFIDNNPKDTASPQYLYKAINLAMGMNNGEKAMELADRYLNEYSNSPKLPEAIFLKAYIYENQLSNLGMAQKTYRDFLTRFPDHELADDAEAALLYLGKSPEEMVREFEKQAAEQAAAAGKTE
ncbi:MAG: hypothetical protein K0B15_13860 [Lentimicrobium sp.]|nr:hypothetical protein [Lentimicrobium sp.]